jgi:hypothetical protein
VNKTEPGICGCGISDKDTDGDGVPDCDDLCPLNPFKVDPGICGCKELDEDSDGDGVFDCDDECPDDPYKVEPGICGCGEPDEDSDEDGLFDCFDGCPNDPYKVDPGICGCGKPDIPGCTLDWTDLQLIFWPWLETRGTFAEVNGLVVIEAEHYYNKTFGAGPAIGIGWFVRPDVNASGDQYVLTLPDINGVIDINIQDYSPRISYRIYFVEPGTYYLWIRGTSDSNDSNTIHFGLNGQPLSGNDSNCVGVATGFNFTWLSLLGNGTERPTFEILSSEIYSFDIWMREDGPKLDKLLLTNNPSYSPATDEESSGFSSLAASGDLNNDGFVDFLDFAILANHWLEGIE